MKKITALLLCFLLVFFTPSAAFASSVGSVVVSGGSIASGGLSGGYSQASESAAVTITMALLYSLGITVNLTQSAIEAGESAYSFVRDKMAEWVGGSSAEQLTDEEYNELKSRFSVINGGSNVGPDGKIYLNGTALDMIRRFTNWLKSKGYIGESLPDQVISTGSINNVSTILTNIVPLSETNYLGFYTGNSTSSSLYPDLASENVLVYRWYQTSTNLRLVFITNKSGVKQSTFRYSDNKRTNTGSGLTLGNDIYWYTSYPAGSVADPSIYTAINDSNTTNGQTDLNNFLNGSDGSIVPGPSESADGGFIYDGDFDPNTLNNPDGNQTVIEPPLVQEMANQNPNADAQIGVAEYLEALRQILNQVTNPQAVPESVPAEDLPTLSPVQLPIPDDLPLTWPVELPTSPTATPDLPTENTPVVDPSQPADPEIAIPEMSVHLEDYFPFCLPFDVYKIMQKFNGSPVAPEVHLSFDAPTLNIHIPLNLDFSVFNSVAAVLRNGEAVLYVVGLAVVTRKTFLRG